MRGGNPVGGQIERRANIGKPRGGAVMAHGGRTHNRAASGLKFTDRRGIERMDRGNGTTIKRGIQARAIHGRAPQGRRPDPSGPASRRSSSDQRGTSRPAGSLSDGPTCHLRALERGQLYFCAGIIQHRTGQHILRLGVGRNAETGHVDADDRTPSISDGSRRSGTPEAVGTQRLVTMIASSFPGRPCHAPPRGYPRTACRSPSVSELNGHIANRPARAIEMRHERQTIDAAGRPRQDRRHALHPQTHPQRPKRRAHRLRLIMRALSGNPWRIDPEPRTGRPYVRQRPFRPWNGSPSRQRARNAFRRSFLVSGVYVIFHSSSLIIDHFKAFLEHRILAAHVDIGCGHKLVITARILGVEQPQQTRPDPAARVSPVGRCQPHLPVRQTCCPIGIPSCRRSGNSRISCAGHHPAE